MSCGSVSAGGGVTQKITDAHTTPAGVRDPQPTLRPAGYTRSRRQAPANTATRLLRQTHGDSDRAARYLCCEFGQLIKQNVMSSKQRVHQLPADTAIDTKPGGVLTLTPQRWDKQAEKAQLKQYSWQFCIKYAAGCNLCIASMSLDVSALPAAVLASGSPSAECTQHQAETRCAAVLPDRLQQDLILKRANVSEQLLRRAMRARVSAQTCCQSRSPCAAAEVRVAEAFSNDTKCPSCA
jgi:hypothetical protein